MMKAKIPTREKIEEAQRKPCPVCEQPAGSGCLFNDKEWVITIHTERLARG